MATIERTGYQQGDVVEHSRRPEWGEGSVVSATAITHEGKAAQRLVIRFRHKGKVTVNTAVAELTTIEKRRDPDEDKELTPPTKNRSQNTSQFKSTATSGDGWLGQISQRNKNEFENELWQLPEPLTDPFLPITTRLKATLETFQYTTNPRSLLDWACSQTGLDDPMSKYTRHELELGYERFGVERERHLKNLIKQLKAKGTLEEAKEVRRWLKIPAAVSALDKAMNQL